MTTTEQQPDTAPGGGPAPMTHRQIQVVLIGLMLGLFLAALDQTIVATALPTIVGELGGLNHLSWVVTAYLVTATASTPLWGKISDLYGRKGFYLAAITIFLVASMLAGLSQEMWQLIVTRGLQGIGGGGLIALTFAIVGDMIPPRQRGRYQGYFGAVFGLSSIVGPLLGGFFVDNLSWRWIFYINLPVGLVALVVTSSVLHVRQDKRQHSIDYAGAALLVAGVVSTLLALVRGNELGWTHPNILTFGSTGIALLVVFVWWESRAVEPILPLRLFRIPVFTVTSVIGFVIGFAMFGAIVFIPLYLQVVDGVSPTASGLLMLPLMFGVITTSMLSGRLITRTGRYKLFPIIGTSVTTVGMILLATLDVDTPSWQTGLYMLVTGLGIGCVMQVLVIAVQNAVSPADMGTATSSSQFFRSLGGTFGTAVFGAIFNNRFAHYLAMELPAGARGAPGADDGSLLSSPEKIKELPAALKTPLLEAFTSALQDVFLAAVPLLLVGVVLSFMLQELKLRAHH